MTTGSSLTLPVITVQPTFPEVIREVQEGIIPFDKFWVSCYKNGEPSIHDKVHAELNEKDRNKVDLTAVEGKVQVSEHRLSNTSSYYAFACSSLSIPETRITSPIQEYKDADRANPAKPHRITAFDVSPDQIRYATGYLDGSVLLYPTTPRSSGSPTSPFILQTIPFPKDSKERVTSKPHLSTVSTLKFFPSSRVLLSAGHDFTVTILPADLPDPSSTSSSSSRIVPVRTLRSHIRPVTSTEILGVGRNIVSASLDATLKVWDVASGEVLHSLNSRSGIHSTCLRKDAETGPTDGAGSNSESFLIYAGLANGAIEVFDLRERKSIAYQTSNSSSHPTSSIAYSPNHHLLASGSEGGIVTLYDVRSVENPLTSFSRLETGVQALSFVPSSSSLSTDTDMDTGGNVHLAVGTTDGLPYVAHISPDGPGVFAELIGSDCDAVRHLSTRDQDLWAAGDDGVVRRYDLV